MVRPDHNFDWVAARYECSPAKVFSELRLGVERDVKARNSTLPSGTGFIVQSDGGMFMVVLPGNMRSVDFELIDDRISVKCEQGRFEAGLTLNDEGQCRLKVGDKELECWQFRKLALENLLFSSPHRH